MNTKFSPVTEHGGTIAPRFNLPVAGCFSLGVKMMFVAIPKPRHAVGFTGKTWRRMTEAEVDAARRHIESGKTLRETARILGREHHSVGLHLSRLHIKRAIANWRTRQKHNSGGYLCVPHPKKRLSPEQEKAKALSNKAREIMLMARYRSERKKLPMDIDAKYVLSLWDKQNGKCALTGLDLELHYSRPGRDWGRRVSRYRTNPMSPSIDRIDGRKGYVRENVRLVCWGMNWALGEWGEDVYTKIARAYFAKQGRKP